MSGCYAAHKNLASMLETIGKFPGSAYFDTACGVILCDSGVPDASENYALLEPGCAVNEAIEHGLDFFGRRGQPHIWPLFPGVDDTAGEILESRGLVREDDFHAMSANTGDCDFEYRVKVSGPIQDRREAEEWAACAWRGFGADKEPPEEFVSNAWQMANSDSQLDASFTLCHAEMKAAGMLFAGGGTCGLYYVAVCPEHRGRGLAEAVVEWLKARARGLGYNQAALLATPSGFGLYLKRGFSSLGAVKIYKMSGCGKL